MGGEGLNTEVESSSGAVTLPCQLVASIAPFVARLPDPLFISRGMWFALLGPAVFSVCLRARRAGSHSPAFPSHTPSAGAGGSSS